MPFNVREKHATILWIALLAALLSSRQVKAADFPVGTEVVTKPGIALKVGEKAVDTGPAHHIYTVNRINGNWLWLVSGRFAGWARATDVMTLDQAINAYSAEIKKDSHAAWAHYNRGLLYRARNKRDDLNNALHDYNSALDQDPKFVPALINRGNIRLVQRSFDSAIVDFTEAIKLDPKDVLAYQNRGIAHQSKGDFEQALTDYDTAIDLGLRTPAIYNNRGLTKLQRQDFEGAIADYTEAITLDAAYARAWSNRAHARKLNGDYEKALADYAEFSRLSPQSPVGYAGRASLRATCPDAKVRDGKEAVELATKARELTQSKDSSCLEIMAAAYAESGDFANAVYWQSQAITLAPKTTAKDAELREARLKLYREKKPFREESPGSKPSRPSA